MPDRRVVHHTPDPDALSRGPSTGEVYAPHDHGEDLGPFQGLVAVRPSAYTQLRESLTAMVEASRPAASAPKLDSLDAVLTTQAPHVTVMVLDRLGDVVQVGGGHVAGQDTQGWVGKHFSAVLGGSSRVAGPIQDALAGRPSQMTLPSALVGPDVAKPGTTVWGLCIPRQEGAHRVAAGAVVLLMSVLSAL